MNMKREQEIGGPQHQRITQVSQKSEEDSSEWLSKPQKSIFNKNLDPKKLFKTWKNFFLPITLISWKRNLFKCNCFGLL